MADRATPATRKRHNDAWRAKNPTYHADYAKRRREEARQVIIDAKTGPCLDCGIEYPHYVMDLDHVRGEKVANLANMKNHPISVILAEIAKCERVCSNCHRIRTHERLIANAESA